jgi:hypothetical protein
LTRTEHFSIAFLSMGLSFRARSQPSSGINERVLFKGRIYSRGIRPVVRSTCFVSSGVPPSFSLVLSLINAREPFSSSALPLVGTKCARSTSRVFCWMVAWAYPTFRWLRGVLLSIWIQLLDASD